MVKLRKILFVFLCLSFAVFFVKTNVNASSYFSLDFENYDGSTAADSYAWNYVNSVCDAPSKSVVSGSEAIDGWSFKTGSPNAGYYYSNGLYALKADALQISSGHWKFSFQVKLENVESMGFRFLEANTDVLYDEITFTPSTNSVVSDSLDYSVTKENDVYTISLDLSPVEGASNYGYFFATFNEGGGYVTLDNMAISESTYDYSSVMLYSFDFENYNGTDSIPAYLWNNTSLYSDSTAISMESNGISGNSLRWDLSNGTYSGGAQLLGMKGAGNDPCVSGKNYEWSFKVKMTNVEKFNWVINYVDNGDKLFTNVTVTSDGKVATDQAASIETLSDGSYLVKIQFPATGSEMFGYFEAVSGDGGVLLFDDYTRKEISKITLTVPKEEPVSQVLFNCDFESWNGVETIPSYVWNNYPLYTNATTVSIDTNGINGKSLRWDLNKGTFSGNDLMGMKGAGSEPVLSGALYEASFKVKMTNVEYLLWTINYVDNGDKLLTTVKVTSDGSVYSDKNASIETLSDGSYLVTVQYAGLGSQIFGNFEARANDNAVLLFDDYTKKTITEITLPIPESAPVAIAYSDFENYNGVDSIPSYLWNNTKLWSDATTSTIATGISGKSLVLNPTSGYTRAAALIGLKGSGNYPVTAGKFYKWSFDVKANNVSDFGLFVQEVVNGADKDTARINLNPQNGKYTANTNASVTKIGDYYHVVLEMIAQGTECFGYFEATSSDNAQIIFDNFEMIEVKKITSPNVITNQDFEDLSNININVETNYYKDEQLLGRLTSQSNYVINGKYSFIGGYDASSLTDKWGKLFGVNTSLKQNTIHTMQFRYKIIEDSEIFYYVEAKNSEGVEIYVRFNGDGIVEAKNIVAEITDESGIKVLKLTFNTLNANVSEMMLATNGGGLIVVDDLSICEGENAKELSSPVKSEITLGTKVFLESFEKQNSGSYLTLKDFISGTDVFGTKWSYKLEDKINGKISLVSYSGNDWCETVVTNSGVVETGKVYTFAFRYMPLSDGASNVNFILRNNEGSEKYIAFSNDGKVRAFTTSGGGFYQDLYVYGVKKVGDMYEAYVTFYSFNSGSPYIALGSFGVCEYVIDDIALFEGDSYSLPEVNKVESPDKNELVQLIENASIINTDSYIPSTVTVLTNAYNKALEVYRNLDATVTDVTEAQTQLQEAISGLITKADKEALNALISELENLALGGYTPSTASALTAKLTEAKELSKNLDALQSEVDSMLQALNSLKESLVLKANKDALNTLISEVEILDFAKYTPSTASALTAKLAEAKALVSNEEALQSEVDSMLQALNSLKEGLVLKANKDALNTLISEVEILDFAKYTPSTASALTAKLAEAKALVSNEEALQSEVDSMLQALKSLKESLVLKANKESLNTLISEVKQLNKEEYTEESIKALTEALTKAEAVLADEEALQASVDNALQQLQNAKEGLVEAGCMANFVNIMFSLISLFTLVLVLRKKR